jgi:hypothetical protein
MKNRFYVGMIAAATAVAAWANYEWSGATGEWSTSAANWWDGSALVPWSNGSYAEMKPAGTGIATDLEVAAGGVTASTYEHCEGATYSLSGGPIAVSTLSVHPGLLTVNNAVSASGTFYVKGKVTIANGGSLVVSKYESAETAATGTDTAVVTVLAGGMLEVTNFTAVGSKYSTLYVDGGTVKHALTRYQDHVAFSNSKIKVGPNGMHVGEAKAGQMSFLPYPVESGGDTDGGVWVDGHSGYYLLYGGNNSYKGGLHIMSGGGQVGIQSDGNLGASTSVPTNSIILEGDGTVKTAPVIVSHSQGAVTLGANRDIFIGDNVMGRLSTYSASSRLVVRGAIGCANRENGVLYIGDYSTGAVVLETAGGRTNHLGRLIVTQPLIVGNGTTLLENTTNLGRASGGHQEDWGIKDGAVMNIRNSGHLMVTGGVLKAMGGRSACVSANMTVSDGGFVDLTGREVLHGYDGPAVTTIRNGGKLVVSNVRMAGDNTSYYSDATKSVINVETGGVLRLTSSMYLTDSNRRATLNFNGGRLDWPGSSGSYFEGNKYPSTTRAHLLVNVKEGGMVVSNSATLYFGPSIRSGAAQDGGITKWGAGEMALWNPTNTFNGPIRVMQGNFATFGSMRNPINTNCAVCVNAGATFRANTSYHTFARIEGSGSFTQNTDRNLTVWQAIAPGMGTNTLGTLTVSGGPINIADGVALEIDVDAAGNSDCLNYSGELDLSALTLHVNDLAKLNTEKKYVIASNLMDATGDFASSNLPNGWFTRYDAAQHKLILYFQRGTVIMVR